MRGLFETVPEPRFFCASEPLKDLQFYYVFKILNPFKFIICITETILPHCVSHCGAATLQGGACVYMARHVRHCI